jgi:hypothetical protein
MIPAGSARARNGVRNGLGTRDHTPLLVLHPGVELVSQDAVIAVAMTIGDVARWLDPFLKLVDVVERRSVPDLWTPV